jgi:hypothetical protein
MGWESFRTKRGAGRPGGIAVLPFTLVACDRPVTRATRAAV